MILIDFSMYENCLFHYGTLTFSGRYPWGSGENPYQRLNGLNSSIGAFYQAVQELRKDGLSEKEIVKRLNLGSLKELQQKYSISKDYVKAQQATEALKLKNKGYSNQAIANKLGLANESSVRSLLATHEKNSFAKTTATAEALANELTSGRSVEGQKYLDIGKGTENWMGISRTQLDTAVERLKLEGYNVYTIKVKQATTGKETTTRVLAPPTDDTKAQYADICYNLDKIGTVASYSLDEGRSYTNLGLKTPTDLSSNRLAVNYKEDGGGDKDGVIELRRGVEDVSLGKSTYAQVRISVDGDYYLKGMAVYSDDLPDGIDVRFNTSKSKTAINPDTGNAYGNSKLEALKSQKEDKDNPFGATIVKQITNSDGTQSVCNIVNDQGAWDEWSKKLPSQVLSKQSPKLAEKQLALKYDSYQEMYEEAMALTNSEVKKHVLNEIAESCDSSAVHLEAAALPRQAAKVILPINTLKDNEIYAPTYKDGEKVALIRYPHAGTFEIPQLIVNNRNKEGQTVITNASQDAVGINSKVAGILSGADFDGDTVVVIPNNSNIIKSSSPLKGLANFDPKESYPYREGMKVMTKRNKQQEMGKITNLIADMTIMGADEGEICRAVKHSMVVIDAEKHKLDYTRSFEENGIGQLKEKYQGSKNSGASTLITRSTSSQWVDDRYEVTPNKETGEKQYKLTGNPEIKRKVSKNGTVSYVKTGKLKQIESTKGAETSDARTLISKYNTAIENIYANHANKLKSLANECRKQAVNIKATPTSDTAKKTYAKEVESLKQKLQIAEQNAPLERLAQRQANMVIRAKKASGYIEDKDSLKKVSQQALKEAREVIGANKKSVAINITESEWNAIQAGALSSSTVSRIISNAKQDQVTKYATPKTDKSVMTASKIARVKAMINAGCTQAEVADALGISVSTVSKAINDKL